MTCFSPAIAVLKWLAKEGVKQNVLILRPLLLSTEEIHSYLGAGFWFVFGCAKMNIKNLTTENTEEYNILNHEAHKAYEGKDKLDSHLRGNDK